MAKKKQSAESILTLPVAFSNVNIGDATARVGITVTRSQLSIAQADKSLCGKRLTGTIIARSNGGGPDQGSLPGLEDDAELEGVFDVSSISVSPKKIGAGLTFKLESIDVATLARFAKREGQVLITGVEVIPDGEEED